MLISYIKSYKNCERMKNFITLNNTSIIKLFFEPCMH